MVAKLWMIWKDPTTTSKYKIGELSKMADGFEFKYTEPDLTNAINSGFDYYPGFSDTSIEKIYKSETLFFNIITRLPNKEREDYEKILSKFNASISDSPFDILAKTKGKLFTDTFSFVKPFEDADTFPVTGIKHRKDYEFIKNTLTSDTTITLELEPENVYDKFAIKVNAHIENKEVHIGYIPKYYSSELYNKIKDKKTVVKIARFIKYYESFDNEPKVEINVTY